MLQVTCKQAAGLGGQTASWPLPPPLQRWSRPSGRFCGLHECSIADSNPRWTPDCCMRCTPPSNTAFQTTPSARRAWRLLWRLSTACASSRTARRGRRDAAAAGAPLPAATAARRLQPLAFTRQACSLASTSPWPCPAPQVRDLSDSLPAALPDGLLGAVHTAEHVAALQAGSAAVTGPTAVRDPDDPGWCAQRVGVLRPPVWCAQRGSQLILAPLNATVKEGVCGSMLSTGLPLACHQLTLTAVLARAPACPRPPTRLAPPARQTAPPTPRPPAGQTRCAPPAQRWHWWMPLWPAAAAATAVAAAAVMAAPAASAARPRRRPAASACAARRGTTPPRGTRWASAC